MQTAPVAPALGSDLVLLTESEAARILRLHPMTLRSARRYTGLPLQYVKIGKSVRYRLSDVERFIQQHLREPGV